MRSRRHAAWSAVLAATLALLGVGSAPPAPPAPPPHTVVGRLDVHAGIWSGELGVRRRVWVLVPASHDPRQRCPVVYAADGQDLFDAATAAGGDEWALDELLAARPAGIPDLVVVGIEAAPEALREYAPPGSRDGARGDAWVRFVADEVRPFVERNYATRRGPEATLVMGQGPAALVALYAAWTRPEVFGGAIALGLPDVHREAIGWSAAAPQSGRPRLWVEQLSGDAAVRTSTTQFVSALERCAEVHVRVAGPQASRVARVAAALRGLLAGP